MIAKETHTPIMSLAPAQLEDAQELAAVGAFQFEFLILDPPIHETVRPYDSAFDTSAEIHTRICAKLRALRLSI